MMQSLNEIIIIYFIPVPIDIRPDTMAVFDK